MPDISYPEEVLADSPIAYWRFEQGSDKLDEGPSHIHIHNAGRINRPADIYIVQDTSTYMNEPDYSPLTRQQFQQDSVRAILDELFSLQNIRVGMVRGETSIAHHLSTDLVALKAAAPYGDNGGDNLRNAIDGARITLISDETGGVLGGFPTYINTSPDFVRLLIVVTQGKSADDLTYYKDGSFQSDYPGWWVGVVGVYSDRDSGADADMALVGKNGYYRANSVGAARGAGREIAKSLSYPIVERFIDNPFDYIRGQGRLFDGLQYARTNPAATELEFHPEGTIEFLFKLDTLSDQTMFSLGGSDGDTTGWRIAVEGEKLVSYIGEYNIGDPSVVTLNRLESEQLEADKWYHAIIRAGMSGYTHTVNGMRVAYLPGFEAATGSDATLGVTFGAAPNTSGRFRGALDEVSIYDSWLSNERVVAHFLASQILVGGFKMPGRQAARATVFQGIQVGRELGPGFGGAATWRIRNMELTPTPDIPVRPVKYPGSKAATDTQVSQSSATLGYSGVLDFNLLPLMLDAMLGYAAPSDVGGGAGHLRSYNPSPVDPTPHPKTLVIEHGSTSGAERMNYGVVSGLTMRSGREEAAMEGSAFGQGADSANRNITITPGLPRLAPRAVHPRNIGWYISADGTNYTKLLGVHNGEINLNGLWGPNYHVRDDNPTFDGIVELMPDFGAQITVDEGSEADQFMSALENSQLVYIGMKATGRLLAAGTGIIDPSTPPFTSVIATGGTLAADTYYVKFTYKNSAGQTKVSPTSTVITTGSTSRIAVNVGPLPLNATGINVFLSTDGTTFNLHGTSANGLYVIDDDTVSTAAPSANTTGTQSTYELLRVNLPLLVTAPDPGDKDNVWGNTFTFVIADDETFGLADIQVVNGISTYD